MTLVVETGTGSSTSESYISVADSIIYHNNRGNTNWNLITTEQQEQALRRSTDYMEQLFRADWKGYRKYATQSLSWPRFGVYGEPVLFGNPDLAYPLLISDTIVPIEVQRACAELALRASAGELYPDVSEKIIQETIGPISTKYASNSPSTPQYKAINAMLSPYLKSIPGSGTSTVVRT